MKFRLLALCIVVVSITFSMSCITRQKHPSGKSKMTNADTSGMTAEQKKIMLQNTLEEKLHYYYKDSAKLNKK